MIKEAIESLVSGRSLSFEEASGVMEEIMGGVATPAQIAAFVTSLRIKGETVDEIAGLASVMRAKAVPVILNEPVVDTCGTGGDGAQSFNISTAAAFVVAGAGLKVAKHGNRAMSSKCGSADVLEALGVKIDLGAANVVKCLQTVGIGFMFAPAYHPAMKYAAPVRRELGIRTVFNILGPLTNPARARFQVIGVPNREVGAKIAAVLQKMGTRHSIVVHSLDGMDELSISARSLVWEVTPDRVMPSLEVGAEDFGLRGGTLSDVRGGSPAENASRLRVVLGGEKGPVRDVVVMNAAAAIVCGDGAGGFSAAARRAEESIDSGRANEKLEGLVRLSQSLG